MTRQTLAMSDEAISREQQNRQALFAQFSRHMRGLYRYAQHLLNYYRATGDLPPGHPDVEDIVDTAVLGSS